MRRIIKLIVFTFTLLTWPTLTVATSKPVAIVIHGGAGTITRNKLSPEQEAKIRATLARATDVGYQILRQGGSSLDAVTETIKVLEDSPLFNAGKGAVFTATGEHELDASMMRGDNLQAGAVAGVKHIKNPVLAARLVMEQSPHVMLSGDGAEQFAKKHGLIFVENSYFDTPYRKAQWKKANQNKVSISADPKQNDYKFGTVGAVALDQNGLIVAATSTGGMTNKAYGRIGDSPIIGAGTYADDRVCGISATGHGEYFIRYAVAHDICARSRYLQIPLQKAADQVINDILKAAGAEGGIIGLSPDGEVIIAFNSKGMYRAFRTSSMQSSQTAIFGEE